MFARFTLSKITAFISAVKTSIYEYMTNGLQHIAEKYLITTIPTLAINSDIEITTVKFLFSRWNIVQIRQTNKTCTLLKPIMDLGEPDARAMYNIIPQITNSSFFLSMNDNKAEVLRQRFITVMRKNHHTLMEAADICITEIIEHLRTQKKFTIEVKNHIKFQLRSCIIFALSGLKLTPATQDALDNIQTGFNVTCFGMLPALPEYIRLIFSQYRDLKHKIDKDLTQFLHDELIRLSKEDCRNHSIITEFVSELYPGIDIQSIVQDEHKLNYIINHPDVRVSITGALAADNLTKCVLTGIEHLYQKIKPNYSNTTSHATAISDEINQYLSSNIELSDQAILNQLSHLNIFWLECLHFRPPMPEIARMSRNGLTVDDITIPPQSMIIYKIDHTHEKQLETNTPAYLFRTARHENMEVKLQKDTFTPFGAGSRMCPAIKVSELIFKKIMIAFANQVVISGNDNIFVREPKNTVRFDY